MNATKVFAAENGEHRGSTKTLPTELHKFAQMLKMGIPREAVKIKMRAQRGVDPNQITEIEAFLKSQVPI